MIDISEVIEQRIEEIKELYTTDPRPWAIGFSGGKDSSAVLKLVYLALSRTHPERLTKRISVVYCDTGVEIPLVRTMAVETLHNVEKEARENRIPFHVEILGPPVKDRYFVKVIGRGYPPPTNKFRWCTNRLRVSPVKRYLESLSEARCLVLLGIRQGESKTRDRTLLRHQNNADKRFFVQSGNSRVTIYSPIRDFDARAVWFTLLHSRQPLAINGRRLVSVYKDANGECPLVRDKSSPACGTSRFGCWTCTVVRRDRAVESLVENGKDELGPLLDFRDWIASVRSNPEYRETQRRNGAAGPGPFTLGARVEIFKRLIETEILSEYELIKSEEKAAIGELWKLDGYKGPGISLLEKAVRSRLEKEANLRN